MPIMDWTEYADHAVVHICRSLTRVYFRDIDVHVYDRVVLFLRFKKEIRQRHFLRTLPNLVFLEHDAYQNYIPCKYQGVFSRHYAAMPWVRVLSSGFQVTQHLRGEGIDAVFVPKACDADAMTNLGRERDIELAFIGSTQSRAYDGRRTFLEALARREKLLVTRTQSGREYVETLNRTRFFVSADVGMGEYMIKNFEAMACGCVLFAYDQGAQENAALGFEDMKNVVLYRDLDECLQKVEQLRQNPMLADGIAAAGTALARASFGYRRVAHRLAEALALPLRRPRIRRLLGVVFKVGWEDSVD